MPLRMYRYAATIGGLLVFLGMSFLYAFGSRDLYKHILTWYGIEPFRFPFLDISAWLAVWECARQGVDVISANPCDVLQRSYSCSPLWIAASVIPLGVSNTPMVGCSLDLLFLLSLSLLPSPRHRGELIVVLAATLSTMVVFALERTNPDVLLFLMALATGILAERCLFLRVLGYLVALLAALLKYYPITILVSMFREARSVFAFLSLLILGCLAVFWAEYHTEIARGLPSISQGPYNSNLFAAKNLPSLLGEVAASAAQGSGRAAIVQRLVAGGLYALLLGSTLSICRGLLGSGELRHALASLAGPERIFLVIGSAVIAGCFFAGQSVEYRGIFFLLVIPGLLAIGRSSSPEVRKLSLGTSIVIIALMWGECVRLALYRAFEHPGIPEIFADQIKFLFWLFRELGWWWTISVMLTVLVDFLQRSPVTLWLSSRWRRGAAGAG
jgi:hypothetical protein